jgi:hypothetical protein
LSSDFSVKEARQAELRNDENLISSILVADIALRLIGKWNILLFQS